MTGLNLDSRNPRRKNFANEYWGKSPKEIQGSNIREIVVIRYSNAKKRRYYLQKSTQFGW